MRPRIVVLAGALSALTLAAAPAVAPAAPHHNRGLTIAATPNPISSGEGVLIYGQLKGSAVSGQTIYLYHRIAGQPRFTLIGHTTTNSFGFYEFTREEGVVLTNRNWFVRGPNGTHSRTIHERVSALVSLSSTSATADTGQPVGFSGAVSPAHPFQRVLLREQDSITGSGFKTIGVTRTDGASAFVIAHRWARPGVYAVQATFPGDFRNIRGESDTITIIVQQKENADFTINSSRPVIQDGQSVTISGVLDQPGTTSPEPATTVALWGHATGQPLTQLATTTTGSDGSYSFTQAPIHNTVYHVRTTGKPHRKTTALYEGVQDVVTMSATSSTGTVGGTDTFNGTVAPDKAGHLIYLQRLENGKWYDVAVSVVGPGSTFTFAHTFGTPGAKVFRARIYGGPENVGGVSPPVTVTVTGVALVTSLPPAS
jgi:hypothetical protein